MNNIKTVRPMGELANALEPVRNKVVLPVDDESDEEILGFKGPGPRLRTDDLEPENPSEV